MHMTDALLSPAVGGAFFAASGALLVRASARLAKDPDERRVPLMGVLGAFVFTAQMINFAIPGTGSSGHLGGGLLLAILLGPHAAFLSIASVLVVQALFFADGGLLALGCNLFNLGFFPAYLAFPYVYRPLAGNGGSRARIVAACVAGALAGLLPGALAVVGQTLLSGVSTLPFQAFAALMLGIHLAIGAVEGAVTAAVILFVRQARPDLVLSAPGTSARLSFRALSVALLCAAAVTGGFLSYRASEEPDGLEWSIERAAGRELSAPEGSAVHERIAKLQASLAPMPDYAWREPAAGADPGTGIAGLLGGALCLALSLAAGLFLKRARRPAASLLVA